MKRKIMKIDTLKDAIKKSIDNRRVYSSILDYVACPISAPEALVVGLKFGSYDWRTTLEELKTEAYKIIDDWDVRCIGQLMSMFPDVLPKSYRNKKMSIYMLDNENCDWVIEFNC